MPHIHEKIDFTVEVFLVYGNTVFLRKHDKYKIWLSVGGHIEPDEDPNQAAIREVKEEVGIDIVLESDIPRPEGPEGFRELVAPRFLNRHRINKTHEHVTMIYFAKSPTDEIRHGATEISDEVHWFTARELGDPSFGLQEHIRFYAERALTELGH